MSRSLHRPPAGHPGPSRARRRARVPLALAGIALALAPVAACSREVTDDHGNVHLTFVTAFPRNSENNDGFFMWAEEVERIAPWITIDYRGGPEVMGPFVLIEGVSSGAIDGAHMPGDYYVDQLAVAQMFRFTPFTPMEERENGVFDLFHAIHREGINVEYLGHSNAGAPQLLFLRGAPVDTADFSGKAIRTSSATSNMVRSMGGAPVDMPGGEIYTAMERGAIDGTGWASVGPVSLGLPDVVDWEIAPRFYDSIANTVMNADRFDSLDQRTQDALREAMVNIEPAIFERYQELSRGEVAAWREAGVERIDLPEADAEEMLEVAYVEAWDFLGWAEMAERYPDAQRIRDAFEDEYERVGLLESVPGGTVIEPEEASS